MVRRAAIAFGCNFVSVFVQSDVFRFLVKCLRDKSKEEERGQMKKCRGAFTVADTVGTAMRTAII